MNDMYEDIPCNICGSNEYEVVIKPERKDFDPSKIISAAGGIMGTQQIVKCSVCGLKYVRPRLKAGFVVKAYRDSVDENYLSQSAARDITFRKCIEIVEREKQVKGRILDVGAASGNFLKHAKERGWEVSGAEPSKSLAEHGNRNYGVNIFAGTLSEARYPDAYFDVITVWDMLEHSTDPSAELAEMRRILKKDGMLVVNFPDIGTLLAKTAGRYWWFLLSNHLYYFDGRSIKNILSKTGFRVRKKGMHFQTLQLGYLAKMIGLYSKPVSKLVSGIVEGAGIANILIKYYASQTNVIAVKNEE
ncbi:MAG: class I SAM-dependent methyltransferase [Endomicrobiales bacterium]|nr:class I SAM-dependent methyltransferase [Endomicrobiales bacterium]